MTTSPTPAADWIEWTGGENPVPGGKVNLRWLGTQSDDVATWDADLQCWEKQGAAFDIIAYRVVSPTPASAANSEAANHDCLAKRREGEPMFILLGRDPDAHNIVRMWAERRLKAGGDHGHCQQGLDTAERMKAYAADPENAPRTAPPAAAYPAQPQPTQQGGADRDEAAIGRDFLRSIEAAIPEYPWLASWSPAEHYGELIGDLLDLAFPDKPWTTADTVAEIKALESRTRDVDRISAFLKERDQSVMSGEADDHERSESARAILAALSTQEVGKP